MNEKDLIKYFEEKHLKGTCFKTLKELKEDKTLVQINAPRALIAVNLMGVWEGLNDGIKKSEKERSEAITTLKGEVEKLDKCKGSCSRADSDGLPCDKCEILYKVLALIPKEKGK